MCQLTLINSPSVALTKAALYIIPARNSRFTHKDGFGFYSKSFGVWKDVLAASNISNMGKLLRDMKIETSPVIAHVRNASKSIKVEKINVHPHESQNVILAHNGTLWFEDELADVKQGEESRESDSARFGQMLSKELDTEPNFVTAFNNCMSKCKGKFAMLIYSKVEDKFYVCRGKTANLHIVDIMLGTESVGFIINTEKNTLEDDWLLVTNTAELMGAPVYTMGKVTSLAEETIWEVVGTGLVEVGKCTENPLPVKTYVPETTGMTTAITRTGGSTLFAEEDRRKLAMYNKYRAVADFMDRERLSLMEMNFLFQKIFNVSLLEATERHIDTFLQYAVGGLGTRKKVRDLMDSLHANLIMYPVYEKCSFPLGINDNIKLVEDTIKTVYGGKK